MKLHWQPNTCIKLAPAQSVSRNCLFESCWCQSETFVRWRERGWNKNWNVITAATNDNDNDGNDNDVNDNNDDYEGNGDEGAKWN